MKRQLSSYCISKGKEKRHKRTVGVSYKQGSYRASFRCFSSFLVVWRVKKGSFLIIGLLLFDSSPPFSPVNPLEKGGVRNLALRENGGRISLALPNSILGLSTINKPLRRRGPSMISDPGERERYSKRNQSCWFHRVSYWELGEPENLRLIAIYFRDFF